jgi:endopeptidase La
MDKISVLVKLKEEEDNKIFLEQLNSKIRNLFESLYKVMLRIQENFDNKIFRKEKYNAYLERVEEILNKVRNIGIIDIEMIKKDGRYIYWGKIEELIDEIKELIKECGMNRISEIIYFFENENFEDYMKKISIVNRKLLDFYNNFFIPLSVNIEEIKNNYEQEKIVEVKKMENLNNRNTMISILEKIDGADLIFYINNHKYIFGGYFKKDPLNITRIGGILELKYNNILEKLKCLAINDTFKIGIVNQLSIRDYLILTESEIVNLVEDNYKELLKIRTKPLSLLVKEFISSNIERQRQILSLFLLSENEDQFLAHIMYDMICNSNELIRAQPFAEEIYRSLHYTIQKIFRVVFKNMEIKISELQNLSEDDIPYEKRISLMKTTDNIKQKALDKLKEIKNSRDGSSKAQQYLDGLLKIPFNIYKKEPILCFIEDYVIRIRKTINELKLRLENYKTDNEKNNFIKDELFKIISLYHDNINTDVRIDNYIKNIEIILEKICISISNINIDFINSNSSIINQQIIISDSFCESNTKNLITDNLTLKNKIISDDNILLKKLQKIKSLSDMIDNGVGIVENFDVENDFREFKEVLEGEEELKKVEEILLDLIKDWVKYKQDKRDYLKKVRHNLNNCVYGQDESKNQLEKLIAQWINGKMEGTVFGFQGPPGTGKTTLAKKGLAKCLIDADGNPRPIGFLPLGGSTNGAILEGHSYTYMGSTWGRIVDILIETKCMNPIIYIDEVDKVSQTEHGREIIGILTHLTDHSQNNEFTDKYFSGIKFDLSKVLFVFSYNDSSLIDRILRDRIMEIKIKGLSKNDKVHIVEDYSLPEILDNVGYRKEDIIIDRELIKFIIETYTNEAGVRKLNEKIFEIIRDINLKRITDDNIKFPYIVSKEYIEELFSDKPKIQIKKIAKTPQIGFVNGLYATNTGLGGLTIIECVKTPSERKLALELTGQQGDVMKESMMCAKTLAWNLIPKNIKKDINDEFENIGIFGLHIHCPEASTPKDGPSAGIAITTAILSRLCGIPVKNNVAMTGEIDLHGNVHPIGGLESKFEGAIKAGVDTVLIPFDNKDDYEKIINKKNNIDDDIIKLNIIFVKTINDVIKNAFVENIFEFIDINN